MSPAEQALRAAIDALAEHPDLAVKVADAMVELQRREMQAKQVRVVKVGDRKHVGPKGGCNA